MISISAYMYIDHIMHVYLCVYVTQVHPEGKFVVDLDKNIEMTEVQSNCRVALRNDSYKLHKILPNKVRGHNIMYIF